jgi:hypothetical protein
MRTRTTICFLALAVFLGMLPREASALTEGQCSVFERRGLLSSEMRKECCQAFRLPFCGGAQDPKVPKEANWKDCRKEDTFKGCCHRFAGTFSATGRTGVPICCWEGTPNGSNGSTTVIEARDVDVYQSDTRGLSCRELQ